MRSVVITGPGRLELNYMWLPTFIGMNAAVKKELEVALQEKLHGQPVDDTTLDWAHDQVVTFLEKRFPFEGLRDYLDSLKFITES